METPETTMLVNKESTRAQPRMSNWSYSYIQELSNGGNRSFTKGVMSTHCLLQYFAISDEFEWDDKIENLISEKQARVDRLFYSGFSEQARKIKFAERDVNDLYSYGDPSPHKTTNPISLWMPVVVEEKLADWRTRDDIEAALKWHYMSAFDSRMDYLEFLRQLEVLFSRDAPERDATEGAISDLVSELMSNEECEKFELPDAIDGRVLEVTIESLSSAVTKNWWERDDVTWELIERMQQTSDALNNREWDDRYKAMKTAFENEPVSEGGFHTQLEKCFDLTSSPSKREKTKEFVSRYEVLFISEKDDASNQDKFKNANLSNMTKYRGLSYGEQVVYLENMFDNYTGSRLSVKKLVDQMYDADWLSTNDPMKGGKQVKQMLDENNIEYDRINKGRLYL